MTVLTASALAKSVLPALNSAFRREYFNYNLKQGQALYSMRFRYGRYSIYKTEYSIEFDGPRSTTLAKGLDKDTATAMMKLLESENE